MAPITRGGGPPEPPDAGPIASGRVGPALTLPEWLILAILSHQPAHGFAVAQQTAPGGELGRIWQIPKAVVYRSIGRLLDAGMITPQGVEPGLGPQRTVYSATGEGVKAAQEWLRTPVAHVREVRSQLLLKLALLDRAGEDPSELLQRQRTALEPIARAIEAQQADCTGFDAILLAWRRSTVQAALDFLDAITRPPRPAASPQPPRLPAPSRHSSLAATPDLSVTPGLNSALAAVSHRPHLLLIAGVLTSRYPFRPDFFVRKSGNELFRGIIAVARR